jgi:uncharacterized protein YndB with AHSA1/START domain
VDDDRTRVELQAEVDAPRDLVFQLFSTAEGLRTWVDEAELDARLGGAVRIRLRDAVGVGTIVAFDSPQHVSFTWDWEGEPLGSRTVVAFDAIEHGEATHLTLRHVGLRGRRRLELHAELWKHWFERLTLAAHALARARPRGTSPSG